MEQGTGVIIHMCTVRTVRYDATEKGWSRGPGILYICVPYGQSDMMLQRRDGAGDWGYYTYVYRTDSRI